MRLQTSVPTLRDTATRLAAGSAGRAEADVPSDVRRVLLDAPLELAADQVSPRRD
jgi:hypothetical protein